MANSNEVRRSIPEDCQAAGQEIPKRPARASNFGSVPVTDSTFEKDVLESDIPVLVDFWAPWAGPCRMIAPVVEEIADQYAGLVKVVKLNTDENPNMAGQYGIRSIPTLMVFKDGSVLLGSIHLLIDINENASYC